MNHLSRHDARVTRRGLQIALGGLWLLDAALQFQPYMFTKAFGTDTIGSAAVGQPWIVAAPVHWAAHLIAAQPVAVNAAFATGQLLLAVGLFWRRSARIALIASIGWALAVWVFGEALGGVFGGDVTLLTGAPGAALLYVFVALAAWPAARSRGDGRAPSAWAPAGWICTWAVGALLEVLPASGSRAARSSALREGADAAPGWLHGPAEQLAGSAGHHEIYGVALVVVALFVTAAAAFRGAPRLASVVVGGGLAVGFWLFGQGLGELFSGQSTDPNTGPLLVLLAVAVAASPCRVVLRGLLRHRPTATDANGCSAIWMRAVPSEAQPVATGVHVSGAAVGQP